MQDFGLLEEIARDLAIPAPRWYMDALHRCGYVIERKVFLGARLCHLVARSRFGDPVLVAVQDQDPMPLSHADIRLYKITRPACDTLGIEGDVCVVSVDALCIVHGGEVQTFGYITDDTTIGIKIGHYALLPVVQVQDILQDPHAVEDKITTMVDNIVSRALDHIEALGVERYDKAMEALAQAKDLLDQVAQVRDKREIGLLQEAYNKIRTLDREQLPDQDKEVYDAIQQELKSRREERLRFIRTCCLQKDATHIAAKAVDQVDGRA